uniref:Uncharacterized protein n=1 Tax=Heterorhabditis bacteriophora TaxID=37862 RepID=A0A1I7W931_HETBA
MHFYIKNNFSRTCFEKLVLFFSKLSNFIINSLKSYFSPGISITFASLPALFLFLSSPLTK